MRAVWNIVYWCDRKSLAACAQCFAPRQQATIEIMLAISLCVRLSLRSIVHMLISAELPRRNLSFYCLLALRILWCYFSRTSRTWWITQSTQRHRNSTSIRFNSTSIATVLLFDRLQQYFYSIGCNSTSIRSKNPSGKRAKRHTVAASNSRDHPTSPLARTINCSPDSKHYYVLEVTHPDHIYDYLFASQRTCHLCAFNTAPTTWLQAFEADPPLDLSKRWFLSSCNKFFKWNKGNDREQICLHAAVYWNASQ